MKKLNVGAGLHSYEDGWETLDNAPLKKKEKILATLRKMLGY